MAKAPGRPLAHDWPGDHSCPVCGKWGPFGHSKTTDWRDGAVWHCADHRPAARDALVPDAAPAAGPKQGRLL